MSEDTVPTNPDNQVIPQENTPEHVREKLKQLEIAKKLANEGPFDITMRSFQTIAQVSLLNPKATLKDLIATSGIYLGGISAQRREDLLMVLIRETDRNLFGHSLEELNDNWETITNRGKSPLRDWFEFIPDEGFWLDLPTQVDGVRYQLHADKNKAGTLNFVESFRIGTSTPEINPQVREG